MCSEKSKKSPPPPTGYVWLATALTLIVFTLLRALLFRCTPESSHSVFHTITRFTEEGVTEIGTFSIVLLALLADSVIVSAWLALLGLALWSAGLLLLWISASAPLAEAMMMAGSCAILLAHLNHFARLLYRRFTRILSAGRLTRIVVLLILAVFGASISLMLFLGVQPRSSPRYAASCNAAGVAEISSDARRQIFD